MTEFEKVLQECLRDLELGNSSIDECLYRYPTQVHQLEPVLLLTEQLERAREARLSEAFKARVRTKLIQQMYAHPRRPARSGFMFIHNASLWRSPLVRLAAGLAAIVLAFLVTGTAYAQNALPGDVFYAWKLASEDAWRIVSSDPVGTDLAIAERRVDELSAVSDDPALASQTLEAYFEVADRLKSEANVENSARILAALDAHIEELNRSGIVLPQPHREVLPPREESTATPTPTPGSIPASTPSSTPSATPLPILETPQVDPPDLPQIVPSIESPPEIVPTIQDLPNVVPVIQDPQNIAQTAESLPELIPTIEITLPIP